MTTLTPQHWLGAIVAGVWRMPRTISVPVAAGFLMAAMGLLLMLTAGPRADVVTPPPMPGACAPFCAANGARP